MTKPVISENFTMEDIRKLRDYNSEHHLKMSKEELIKKGEQSMAKFLEELYGKDKEVAG